MLDVRGKGGKNGSAVLGLMERKDGVVIYWDGVKNAGGACFRVKRSCDLRCACPGFPWLGFSDGQGSKLD